MTTPVVPIVKVWPIVALLAVANVLAACARETVEVGASNDVPDVREAPSLMFPTVDAAQGEVDAALECSTEAPFKIGCAGCAHGWYTKDGGGCACCP